MLLPIFPDISHDHSADNWAVETVDGKIGCSGKPKGLDEAAEGRSGSTVDGTLTRSTMSPLSIFGDVGVGVAFGAFENVGHGVF